MVWLIVTISGIVVMAAVMLGYRAKVLTERQLDNALKMTAIARSDSLALGMSQHNAGGSDYFTLVDRNGDPVIFSDNLTAPIPLDKALLERSIEGDTVYDSVRLGDVGQLRVIYLPVLKGAVSGDVLLVGVPADIFGDETRGFIGSALITAFAVLVLSAVSAFIFAKRTADPIKEMTSAAQRITAENLTEKLPDAAEDDDIRRLVNVLNEMLSRLESAFVAQRRFSSRVAHELRTPLTILKGETQVMLNRRRTVDDYEAHLVSILEEVAKMERTIDDLLLFARYESGESDIPFRPINLGPIIADVAKDLRSIAASRRIDFKTKIDDDAVVLGEEQALHRLVCKLVENALYYTPEGGRVVVRSFDGDGAAVLSVEDNGVGIDPDDLPHIFERFFRSERSRHMHSKGTGIGLALVDVIVQLHKAEISVQSHPGKGTTFKVRFPVGR
jgi:signal transduction histidine kinase